MAPALVTALVLVTALALALVLVLALTLALTLVLVLALIMMTGLAGELGRYKAPLGQWGEASLGQTMVVDC